MILTRNIERKDFYYNFYKSLNYVLNLSNKELDILSHFSNVRANLPREYSSSQLDAITFNSSNRKKIALTLGISIFNLNNYIKSLKTKGILVKSDKKISIHPRIFVDINTLESPYSNEYKFNIV